LSRSYALAMPVDTQIEKRRQKADALDRFERLTALPMLILSIAIIPLLVIPLIWKLSERVEATFFALDWLLWAAFAMEYGVRLYLAPQKWQFVKRNKIDLAVVLIPFLRPLRVARSARVLRLLRAVRVVVALGRSMDAARDVLTRHNLHYALAVMMLAVVGSAFLVEAFEREAPDANIQSLPDALWWAVTTVTTVGYGDRFPTTPAGRGVAVALMLLGIALFGFLAGNLASFFIERKTGSKDEPSLSDIAERLERIERALGADDQPR
jgi:voltage-gated potassium channel